MAFLRAEFAAYRPAVAAGTAAENFLSRLAWVHSPASLSMVHDSSLISVAK